MAGGVVYILKLNNGKHYIGSTNDIDRRIHQHTSGYCLATKHLRPIEIIYKKSYDSLIEARRVENQLKKQKSVKMIKQFMNNN